LSRPSGQPGLYAASLIGLSTAVGDCLRAGKTIALASPSPAQSAVKGMINGPRSMRNLLLSSVVLLLLHCVQKLVPPCFKHAQFSWQLMDFSDISYTALSGQTFFYSHAHYDVHTLPCVLDVTSL